MNLFVLDSDLQLNAEYHVDTHVVKMPLEAAQLACTALIQHGATAQYKPTHVNHPCAKWARETRSNFIWTCEYGLALCKEYNFRYGKFHKCADVLKDCLWKYESIPLGEQTDFAIAIPEQHLLKFPKDAVSQYRNYYNWGKRHLHKWTNRPTPDWIHVEEGV